MTFLLQNGMQMAILNGLKDLVEIQLLLMKVMELQLQQMEIFM